MLKVIQSLYPTAASNVTMQLWDEMDGLSSPLCYSTFINFWFPLPRSVPPQTLTSVCAGDTNS